MAIIVPDNYHAKKSLEKRRVHCISSFNAQKQDLRPLRIAILNIMPEANTYEYNILFPIGRAIIQIEPVWIRLNTHEYKSTSKAHPDELYVLFDEAIRTKGLDGLIITGAPVEEKSFDDIWFWDELSGILDYAKENIASTLGICWGGLALANYMGIDKMLYDKKLFGVYPLDNLDRNHRITGDLEKGRNDVRPPLNLDINNPKNNWCGHSLEFFQQWVKDVYIRTPYEI